MQKTNPNRNKKNPPHSYPFSLIISYKTESYKNEKNEITNASDRAQFVLLKEGLLHCCNVSLINNNVCNKKFNRVPKQTPDILRRAKNKNYYDLRQFSE